MKLVLARYGGENEQRDSPIPAKQLTPPRAPQEKEPATSIFHCSAQIGQAYPMRSKPTFVEGWKWGREHEHAFGLMRLEITQYLVKITSELADILGIALYDVN
jgi:hypothetical protein